jgi:hypothetical protein
LPGDEVTLELARAAGRGSGWNQGIALNSVFYPVLTTVIAIGMPFLAMAAGATLTEGVICTAVFTAMAVGTWRQYAPDRRAFFWAQPRVRVRCDAVVFEFPALLARPLTVPLADLRAFARLDGSFTGLPVFGSGSTRRGAPNFAFVFKAPQPVPAVGRQGWSRLTYFGYVPGAVLKGGELIPGIAIALEEPSLADRELTEAGVPEMSQGDLLGLAPPHSDGPWAPAFFVALGIALLLLAALVVSSQAA